MKPCSDVCLHCDKLHEQMKFSCNEQEAAKALAWHMESAQEERQYYGNSIDAAKEDATSCHLIFDFA